MTGRTALDAFLSTLSRCGTAVLLLDYDGTLAPFQVVRHMAKPYPGVRGILRMIREQTATRLVIISGRTLDDLIPLLALHPSPELWGGHGWERLDAAGRRSLYPLATGQKRALGAAWAVIEEQQLAGYCELKPASIAVHWRGLAEADATALARRVKDGWQEFVTGQLLELHPFDGGLELRAAGRTKASAVNEILAELGADQVVAFLGDDLTDEDGFRAIRDRGLGVLVRQTFRPTAAAVHLRPPRELLGFLNDWLRLAPRLSTAKEGCP